MRVQSRSMHYAAVRIPDWTAAKTLAHTHTQYIFRGQASAAWGLASALERATEFSSTGIPFLASREDWILYQFKRRAHLIINAPPPDESWLDWQALIQHHGGPTRLLDFTHSFYIAAYFALERATDDTAVWGINWVYLYERNARDKHANIVEQNANAVALLDAARRASLADSVTPRGVVHVEPVRLNERMAIQKGVFVAPLDVARTFMENLAASLEFDLASHNDCCHNVPFDAFLDLRYTEKPVVVKFILPARHMRTFVLNDLASMNIDSSTLFPGLDGFARSLHQRV
jgi:hypothetical protein